MFGLMRKLSDLFAIQPYLCILYRAMFITAYFWLFRISKIATTPSGHTIRAHDVHLVCNKNKLLFILRSSKTHGKGAHPQMIRISAQENEQTENNCSRKLTFCPFNCIRDYISARRSIKKDTEPFFVFSDRSPVMASHFTTVLKKTIKSLNLNSKPYSSHCLRSGRTCDLLAMGVSIEKIKLLCRWKSNAVYAYLR